MEGGKDYFRVLWFRNESKYDIEPLPSLLQTAEGLKEEGYN